MLRTLNLCSYCPPECEPNTDTSSPFSLILQRYFGCAIGKGSRAAKTEIEKQKFGEKTCRESLGLLAKMYTFTQLRHPRACAKTASLTLQRLLADFHTYSLLLTHEDSSSDKPYKLEMSWVCEETKWQHKRISDDTMYATHNTHKSTEHSRPITSHSNNKRAPLRMWCCCSKEAEEWAKKSMDEDDEDSDDDSDDDDDDEDMN